MSEGPFTPSTEPPADGTPRAWPRLVLAVPLVAGLAWLLRTIDLARVGSVLRGASWPLVALAGALDLGANTLARALRWRELLPANPRTLGPAPVLGVAAVVLASLATSAVLPLRAGEAVRTIGLRDRYGYALEPVVASQLVERLVELLTLATLGLPLALLPGSPRRLVVVLAACACAAALAVAIVVLVARAHVEAPRGRAGRLVARTIGALRQVRDPRALARSFAFGLASDLVDVALVALSAAAVGVHLGLAGAVAVLVAVNLAIALPSTPAQVGVLEAGAVIALVGLGVDRSQALAVALVYHVVHVVPVTLAGAAVIACAPRASGGRAAP